MSVTGGCLCGKVRYEIRGQLLNADHCHCSMCRRQHGAAFATYADFDPDAFKWTAGESLVKAYETTTGAGWCFCGECGCSLFFDYPGEERISIAAGTLDDSSGLTEKAHIYAGEAGCYYKLPENLVQDEWVALDCPE